MLLLQPSHLYEILLSVNLMFFVVVTCVTMVTNLCIMRRIPELKYILQRNYIIFFNESIYCIYNRFIIFDAFSALHLVKTETKSHGAIKMQS